MPQHDGATLERPRPADGASTATRTDRDGNLVEALRHGAPTAAEQLVDTYGGRAYRLAIGITRNAPDAEEVVQDAFCSVIRNIETFRGESAFGSWLYRIVANAAYQKLRGRAARPIVIAFDDVLPSPPAERGAEPTVDWSSSLDDPSHRTELRLALTAAIDELPAAYRTALVLHDVEGLENTELAAVLGLTVANVKSRLHRARLFVRQRLASSLAPAARRRRPLAQAG
jgi:RNA polymerase sigma-70 factor, ECF subfamily